MAKPIVAVVMGSESDKEIMENAVKTLKEFGIPYEVKIMSAHRTPKIVADYALKARQKGLEVIIAGAGKAAHLPGVIAAYTTIPVIGVPIKTKDLGGLDSLLSIVQMPIGVPVASVAINGAKNAAILACQILSIKYPQLKLKLQKFKNKLSRNSPRGDSGIKRRIGALWNARGAG